MATATATTKVCNGCGFRLPIQSFHRMGVLPSGRVRRNGRCAQCRKPSNALNTRGLLHA